MLDQGDFPLGGMCSTQASLMIMFRFDNFQMSDDLVHEDSNAGKRTLDSSTVTVSSFFASRIDLATSIADDSCFSTNSQFEFLDTMKNDSVSLRVSMLIETKYAVF